MAPNITGIERLDGQIGTSPSHIFIVGSPRSGTTLLRFILNCSDEVAICGETHFLGTPGGQRHTFRKRFARVGDIKTDTGAKRVVDYIYKLRVKIFWLWIQRNVARSDFLSELLKSDRTDRALLDLVTAFYARDKPVRGEKTPSHIYHVHTLLEWFPRAKIVHVVRDPRAIFMSKIKKKIHQKDVPLVHRIVRKSNFALNCYYGLSIQIDWLRIMQLHQKYQRFYPNNYCLVRYEDLITDPLNQLKQLCDFLNIQMTEKMLEPQFDNSSFRFNQDQTRGFNTDAVDRWRQQVSPFVRKWFTLWCRQHFLELGYPL